MWLYTVQGYYSIVHKPPCIIGITTTISRKRILRTGELNDLSSLRAGFCFFKRNAMNEAGKKYILTLNVVQDSGAGHTPTIGYE